MKKAIYQTLDNYLSKKTSRRDFIQAVTAMGFTSMAAESLLASAQLDFGSADEPGHSQPRMVEGSAGSLIVEQLKAAGVKYIFHTNTSGLESITDAVDTNEMQVIMITHEGQAVSAVEGYALASGQLGFFMGSKVGVGNSISNLYNAWKDRTPMIVSYGRSTLKGQGGQDGFEEWDDHLKPTEPFAAWSWSCVDAESMPKTLRRAMKFAFTPPGAPVTLDFPPDLLRTKVRAPIYKIDPTRIRPVFRAGKDRIEKAAELLAQAKSPVFIVGPEITRGEANGAMVALAEKLGVPVCQGEGLYSDFPTHHPLFMERYSPRMRFPKNVDLVINLGAKDVAGPPQGGRLIHASNDADIIGRRNPSAFPIHAHVSTVIADLTDALDGILTKDRMSRIQSERLAQAQAFNQKLRKSREITLRARFDDSPLAWERVGYELEKALDKNAVLVPEIGSQSPKVLSALSQGKEEKWRIGRTVGSALGWGVGAALGVQLALPDRQVVALQGDGGFMFGQGETLWSIARYEAPILIVVMNNHSYNETRNRNMSANGRQFQTGKELTSYLGDPDIDFTKIAEAFGIAGQKVFDPADLGPAIQRALKTMRDGKPFLLDLEVARDGMLSGSNWHSPFSIAQLGRKMRG